MRKLIGGLALVASLAALAGAATALATDGAGIDTEELSRGRIAEINLKTDNVKLKTKGDSDVYVVRNTVMPGGHSGWHTHPGPSLITVKQGTATFYEGDDPTCTAHVYPEKTTVIDPGDGHVHILRNEGSIPLVTVTAQIVPAGAPRRINVVPSPGNCPF